MLEKLVKNIGRKITIVALAGTLLLGSGCATYRTMSPSLIQPVTPIERPIERPIDYSKLTWREAIEYVQTPEQAQDYLNSHFQPDYDEATGATSGIWIPGLINTTGVRGETFKHNHERAKGVCFDYATSAATLLSDNGYPPLLLDMRSDGGGHTVFLYRTSTGLGVLGYTPLSPISPSVEDILGRFYINYGLKFDRFNVYNLDDNFPSKKWISGDFDLYTKMNP